MAEIEHFCDPKDKSHPKFGNVKDLQVTLYSACNQMEGKMPEQHTIGEAVGQVKRKCCFDANCERNSVPFSCVIRHCCLFAETNCQRNSGLFHGENIPVHGESWCGPKKVAIPSTHEQRNGSLRLWLLGRWMQNLLREYFFFLWSCQQKKASSLCYVPVLFGTILRFVVFTGLGGVCRVCRQILLWSHSALQGNRCEAGGREAASRTNILFRASAPDVCENPMKLCVAIGNPQRLLTQRTQTEKVGQMHVKVHSYVFVLFRSGRWCPSFLFSKCAALLKLFLTVVQVEKEIVEVVPKKAVLGKAFKKDAQRIIVKLSRMDESEIAILEAKIAEGWVEFHPEFSLSVGCLLSVVRFADVVQRNEIFALQSTFQRICGDGQWARVLTYARHAANQAIQEKSARLVSWFPFAVRFIVIAFALCLPVGKLALSSFCSGRIRSVCHRTFVWYWPHHVFHIWAQL